MRLFRYFLMCFALLVTGLIFPAKAADVFKTPSPVHNVFKWDGFYVGGHAGYLWGDATSPGLVAMNHGHGTVGGQIGYRKTYGNFLIGLETEWSYHYGDDAVANPAAGVSVSHSINYSGDVKAVLGITMNRSLLYGFAGMAIAQANATINAPGFSIQSNDTYHVGWTAGAGWEYALFNNMSIRVQYAYRDFGSADYSFAVLPPVSLSVPGEFTTHDVKLGLNILF